MVSSFFLFLKKDAEYEEESLFFTNLQLCELFKFNSYLLNLSVLHEYQMMFANAE